MPSEATFRMLKKYEDTAPPQMFLSSLFQTPPENYHDSQKVTVDVVRNDPRVAVPIPGGMNGTRKVEMTKYQNKEFEPAVFDTEVQIASFNSFKRVPGVDPFDPQAGLLNQIVPEAMSHIRAVDAMTRRGVELQCAQVLTTGAISSVDAGGAVVFAIDFQPKGTHFVTPTAWAADGSTGDPEGDVSALAEVVRRDGKLPVTQLIAGRIAIQRLLISAKIRANLNLWNVNFGKIEPVVRRPGGAMFHGTIQLGTEMVELWSYKETYIHPQTLAQTPFIPDNKVILRAPDGRLDLTYGSIPTIVPPDARVAQFLPSRMSNPQNGFDVSINAYVTPDNKHLALEVGTRALAIPTALDTFGCLTVF